MVKKENKTALVLGAGKVSSYCPKCKEITELNSKSSEVVLESPPVKKALKKLKKKIKGGKK